MKLKLLTFMVLLTVFYGCKKEYACYCPDPRSCDAFEIKASTKLEANKKCKNTKNPFNDSECYIVNDYALFKN